MTPQDSNSIKLVDFIKRIAAAFWFRIEFVRGTGGIRVSEVSLTEELVYQFHLMAFEGKLPVKIFQSNYEHTNGSDLEILLEIDGKVIKFPCQAKIIYATRRYGALRHKVGSTYQIDLLLRYAREVGGYPIYMFYNYDQYLTEELLELTDGSPYPWGCSFGSAKVIKDKFFNTGGPTPLFRDLHPSVCWPLHMLFEPARGKVKEKMLRDMLPEFNISSLRSYSLEEVLSDPFFNDVSAAGQLGSIDHYEEAIIELDKGVAEARTSFSPRFRILISSERIKGLKITMLE